MPKLGASPEDIRDMRRMINMGKDVETIAKALDLTEMCVASFMPEAETEPEKPTDDNPFAGLPKLET